MSFFTELGPDAMKLGETPEMSNIGSLIKDYQAMVDEALKTGNTERENYYRAKIERLSKDHRMDLAEKDGIGAIPFPELAHEQGLLNDYKRTLSSLERQRRPGVKDVALERRIASIKEKVAQQEREVARARQQRQSQLMSPYRSEESILGTHQGASTETGHQGKISDELGTHQGKTTETGHQGKISDELGMHQGKTTETGHQGEAGKELSFGGGAGIKNIAYQRGAGMVSDANQKTSTAAILESDARRARTAGDSSRADQLESRARSLRSEAKSLEAKGKDLMNKNRY